MGLGGGSSTLTGAGLWIVQSLGVVAASEPGFPGSETLVYTGSPSVVLSAGFTRFTTLGTGCWVELALTDGLTGATGITLFAPDEATSAPLGRRLGVRSMVGNCISVWAFGPSTYFSS